MEIVIIIYQDNGRVHTCAIPMAELHDLKFEFLTQPTVSAGFIPQ